MKEQTKTKSAIKLLEALTERAKELTCLYAIEETLKEPDADIDQVCDSIIRAIPPGWQFPDVCVAKITLEGKEYQSPGFEETPWKLCARIVQQDHVAGTIGVYYTREMPAADIGPFLKEEKKLIETIADRLNHFLTYKKMKHVFQEWQSAGRDLSEGRRGDWEAVLDLIRQTDKALFLRISNKMLNHLCWSGIEEADALRRTYTRQERVGNHYGEESHPRQMSRLLDFSTEFTERIFRIAADHLSNDEILSRIQMWIQEDKLGALLQTVRSQLPLAEVANALRRYFFTTHEEADNRYPLARGLKVLLIGSILSDRLEYLNVAKDNVDIEDLYQLLQKVIFSAESHGKLGGKSSGFFLAAQIMRKTKEGVQLRSPYRIPKTWYISADMMLDFVHYNNMDEIVEQKYKEVERVRLEYPHVIDIFAQSLAPPELVHGLSMALDDFGGSPLIVRSSSLLEDRTGAPFVGKYKSVVVGNQGTRDERLRDLVRAVAEVYASNFGPHPIEYRAERGLLEFSEQLGILIQEVVGARVGPYFLPIYSGMARSRNDFQWSPEIQKEDGIVRIIPGLGTGAADRAGDEHPVLVIPGRPSLGVNRSAEESVRYAPRRIDVVNLETNDLQTMELGQLLRDWGDAYPYAEQVVSVYEDGQIRPLDMERLDFEKGQVVATFDGLITRSPFLLQLRDLLQTLEQELGGPVEIEFASDGEHIYLLQCRPQILADVPRPAPIPKDIAADKILFSANRYVSNGWVPNITHIVYVDPANYQALEDPSHCQAVEQALGRLNELLPKRQFMFMGPSRRGVGSAGQGGMEVNRSDVKNAAALVELVESDGTAPSCGMRFLQDLVEWNIRYLPVFPHDEGTSFNERFLKQSRNLLPELLPEHAFLADVVRVIDVSRVTDGKVVQLLMNAELDEAVAFLTDSEEQIGRPEKDRLYEDSHPESYWRWRYRMAEQVASQLDPTRFGVVAFYLFGSTKNGTAGPASDIDVLIHFRGTKDQRDELELWLEGWSLCLDEINYLQTGYRSGGLLDVHLVTDEDIAKRTSYAVKINAVTDAACPLKMKEPEDSRQPVSGSDELSTRHGAN